MKLKLSERASLLLWIVAKNTERNWETGELSRFFLPHAKQYFYNDNGKQTWTYISGAGDANALKGLERKGLIEIPKTNILGGYIYALTEDGLLALEELGLNKRFS